MYNVGEANQGLNIAERWQKRTLVKVGMTGFGGKGLGVKEWRTRGGAGRGGLAASRIKTTNLYPMR